MKQRGRRGPSQDLEVKLKPSSSGVRDHAGRDSPSSELSREMLRTAQVNFAYPLCRYHGKHAKRKTNDKHITIRTNHEGQQSFTSTLKTKYTQGIKKSKHLKKKELFSLSTPLESRKPQGKCLKNLLQETTERFQPIPITRCLLSCSLCYAPRRWNLASSSRRNFLTY